MKFQKGGIVVTLQRDPSLSKTLVSLKAMVKAFKENGERMPLELRTMAAEIKEAQKEAPVMLRGVVGQIWEGFLYTEGAATLQEEGSCHKSGFKNHTD